MARWPVLHFACHADADAAEPLASCLLVADDERLRLADLLAADAVRPKVVVLSACETALIGTELPDEVVNLPSGFLQAGARGVIGSLWPVYDDATAALMQRFYARWRGTDPDLGPALDPAAALRAAQQWLRDGAGAPRPPGATPAGRDLDPVSLPDAPPGAVRSHPVSWAAFAYVGA
jgi:CHAT domain-containing protein